MATAIFHAVPVLKPGTCLTNVFEIVVFSAWGGASARAHALPSHCQRPSGDSVDTHCCPSQYERRSGDS